MVSDTLRRFLSQANGSTRFTLPSGEEIDVRVKQSRQFLSQWIVRSFDGDERNADRVLNSLIPRALRNAKAPWPYLIKALHNSATNYVEATAATDSLKETSWKLVSKLGRCRLDLLQQVVRASVDDGLTIGPLIYDLKSHSDLALIINWLMGEDPYVLFHFLCPQNEGRYVRENGLQILVDDLVSVRPILAEMQSLPRRQLALDAFLKKLRGLFPMPNEFTDSVDVMRSYYAAFSHPVHHVARVAKTRSFKFLTDLRQEILSSVQASVRKPLDELKAAWLEAALATGIVTDPLSWIFDVLDYGQICDEWMIPGWTDRALLCSAFGLKPIKELFPGLTVKRDDRA